MEKETDTQTRVRMNIKTTAFQKGAEFGYNQCKVKANEWHKQDTDNIYDSISTDLSVKHYLCIMKDKSWVTAIGNCDEGCNGEVSVNLVFDHDDEKYYMDDIMWWREIVLPKRLKKMTKDEMKNRIRMALKDLVLQHGFEIICKENTELENENAELREQCSTLADCNICHSTCKTEDIELKKQLTKAKEIIKNLINSLMVIDGEEIRELSVVKEAERLLNSENI